MQKPFVVTQANDKAEVMVNKTLKSEDEKEKENSRYRINYG